MGCSYSHGMHLISLDESEFEHRHFVFVRAWVQLCFPYALDESEFEHQALCLHSLDVCLFLPC